MRSNRGLSLLSEQVAGKGFEQLGRGGVGLVGEERGAIDQQTCSAFPLAYFTPYSLLYLLAFLV